MSGMSISDGVGRVLAVFYDYIVIEFKDFRSKEKKQVIAYKAVWKDRLYAKDDMVRFKAKPTNLDLAAKKRHPGVSHEATLVRFDRKAETFIGEGELKQIDQNGGQYGFIETSHNGKKQTVYLTCVTVMPRVTDMRKVMKVGDKIHFLAVEQAACVKNDVTWRTSVACTNKYRIHPVTHEVVEAKDAKPATRTIRAPSPLTLPSKASEDSSRLRSASGSQANVARMVTPPLSQDNLMKMQNQAGPSQAYSAFSAGSSINHSRGVSADSDNSFDARSALNLALLRSILEPYDKKKLDFNEEECRRLRIFAHTVSGGSANCAHCANGN